ncbi:hypothetical protein [Erwinia mallotivora]|uniref:hypothetical protein n=1 Tax=Erwinia mallotivora TaxID=69222 RepID=UPI0021BFD674|nr:hypothetical protein [Erwinia mallotivora]
MAALDEQLINHRAVFNKIDGFKKFIDAIESKGAATEDALNELQKTMDTMIQQIQNIRNKLSD